jgi:hypothetical protein
MMGLKAFFCILGVAPGYLVPYPFDVFDLRVLFFVKVALDILEPLNCMDKKDSHLSGKKGATKGWGG